ncbi:biotin-dependent carboxyltransferase [Deinococcus cavernae]|uniref:Biotin-dependent carboxyltransferase n=1 Tax=Deinococcus cavernae TaxID=2320857 RepID=A0A418V5L8_9DEIO|nr:biotin-dependent carboxyltransferase family protein [Deinococcus cavernae]RJF71359.1 biotin-dependent carboxyltransferase [Deinococcus cavernae]
MVEVLRPGLQSTLQDTGRRVRALGIPSGGAADSVALRLANALVGNAADAAALEITLSGPKLRFRERAVVALCGAPFQMKLEGVDVPLNRAFTVQAGETLDIGGTSLGMRAVLALRGGLNGDVVFGSRSTDLRSGFGGRQGHAIQKGDELTVLPAEPRRVIRASLHPSLLTSVANHQVLRVLATAEAAPALLADLTRRAFTVSTQADRMGVRLQQNLSAPHDPARVSLPNVTGMVQLPPDGRPILLLPDSGTHGGYPTPLVVARVDLPRLAQLRPRGTVQFKLVNAGQATAALREAERTLRQTELTLQWLHAQGA